MTEKQPSTHYRRRQQKKIPAPPATLMYKWWHGPLWCYRIAGIISGMFGFITLLIVIIGLSFPNSEPSTDQTFLEAISQIIINSTTVLTIIAIALTIIALSYILFRGSKTSVILVGAICCIFAYVLYADLITPASHRYTLYAKKERIFNYMWQITCCFYIFLRGLVNIQKLKWL